MSRTEVEGEFSEVSLPRTPIMVGGVEYRIETVSDTWTGALRLEIPIVAENGPPRVALECAFSTDTVECSYTNIFGSVAHYRAEYGLLGGDLHVNLHNAKAPLANRYNPEIPDTYKASRGRSHERSRTTNMGATFEFGSSAKFGPSFGWEDKKSATGSASFEYDAPLLTASGSDEKPVWRFDSGSDYRHLTGRVRRVQPPLATLRTFGDNIEISARFRIWAEDVRIVDVHSADSQNEIPKKHLAVIGKALPRLILNSIPKKEDGQWVLSETRITLER